MKKTVIIFSFLVASVVSNATGDTLTIERVNQKIDLLQNKVEEVKRDQLNYSIEKDLIKDTYSNNYDKINLFITGILLIFGFLGFIGFRDISSLKKEYKEELDKLKNLQIDIEAKSKEFEKSKIKLDNDITEIIKQNEEQNRKLKVLEIKEKIDRLFKEREHVKALEFCIIALEYAPNDLDLLRIKSQIYSRTLKYDEAINTFKRILEIDPNYSTAIFDLSEIFLFAKNEEACDELIKKYPDLFSKKEEGQLLFYFELIKHYNKSETTQLKDKIIKAIDRKDLKNKKKRIQGWDFYDALFFMANQPDDENRKYLQNYLWYLDGQLNAKETLERIGEKVDEEEKK